MLVSPKCGHWKQLPGELVLFSFWMFVAEKKNPGEFYSSWRIQGKKCRWAEDFFHSDVILLGKASSHPASKYRRTEDKAEVMHFGIRVCLQYGVGQLTGDDPCHRGGGNRGSNPRCAASCTCVTRLLRGSFTFRLCSLAMNHPLSC